MLFVLFGELSLCYMLLEDVLLLFFFLLGVVDELVELLGGVFGVVWVMLDVVGVLLEVLLELVVVLFGVEVMLVSGMLGFIDGLLCLLVFKLVDVL